MADERLESDDEARERAFWSKTGRWLWTVVFIATAAGGLGACIAAFGWGGQLLLSGIGVLTGLSLSLTILGSSRGRELAGILLGGLLLPLIAVWLTRLSARNPELFGAYSAALAPFLVHASVTVATASLVRWVWRDRAAPPPVAPAGASAVPDEGGAP